MTNGEKIRCYTIIEEYLYCQPPQQSAVTEGEERKRNGYPTLTQSHGSGSVSVNGNVSGTYKRNVNSALTKSKLQVITTLNECTYKTPPKKISRLLAELFTDYVSKDGHWLYIAQNWPPRAICRVIAQMNKQHQRGEIIRGYSLDYLKMVIYISVLKTQRNGVYF